jgi:hypothetical protein
MQASMKRTIAKVIVGVTGAMSLMVGFAGSFFGYTFQTPIYGPLGITSGVALGAGSLYVAYQIHQNKI